MNELIIDEEFEWSQNAMQSTSKKRPAEQSRGTPETSFRDAKVSAAIEAIGDVIARSNKIDAYLKNEKKPESARNHIVVTGWGRGKPRPQNFMKRDI